MRAKTDCTDVWVKKLTNQVLPSSRFQVPRYLGSGNLAIHVLFGGYFVHYTDTVRICYEVMFAN